MQLIRADFNYVMPLNQAVRDRHISCDVRAWLPASNNSLMTVAIWVSIYLFCSDGSRCTSLGDGIKARDVW